MKEELLLPPTIKECHELIKEQQKAIKEQREIIHQQQEKIVKLEGDIEALKRAVFGVKSEKISRLFKSPPSEEPERPKKRKSSQKQPLVGNQGVSGLRFLEGVEVVVIEVPNPDIQGLSSDEYEYIGFHEVDKLAYKKSYYIKRYRYTTYKIKETGTIVTPPTPFQVIPGALADTSFLVSLVIDKILYHTPLYRIHQKLEDSGIYISRGILTDYIHTIGDSLEVLFQYHLESVLEGKTLTLDETQIKAGVDREKNKMNTGFFWGVSSERNEYVYMFFENRKHENVHTLLGEWKKRQEEKFFLSDDYGAYTAFASKVQENLLHALCWSHCRRAFYGCEAVEPSRVRKTLLYYTKIYNQERVIREQGLDGEDKKAFRLEHTKPLVEELFTHLTQEQADTKLLPNNPYRKALTYVLDNQKELRVFLEHPNVPIDTNHIERQNKKIAIGRKNYLFCFTEVGAHYLGIFYSLLITAKELGINCQEYLLDILTRMPTLSTEEIRELVPYQWNKNRIAQTLPPSSPPPLQHTG